MDNYHKLLKMIVKREVQFKSNQAAVWDMLTNSEMTQQYMYGCKIISNWAVGGTFDWEGVTEDGAPITYVKGFLLEMNEPTNISFSMIDPFADYEDIPENYIQQGYTLEANAEGTLVTFIQSGFEDAANGQKRYEDCEAGWDMVIPLMKGALGE